MDLDEGQIAEILEAGQRDPLPEDKMRSLLNTIFMTGSFATCFDSEEEKQEAIERMLRNRYKGAKEKSNYKKRQEIEIEVSDSESTQKLLLALGYKGKLTVEKKRRLWRLGGCEVALDRLNVLGDFVEIEGPDDEKISHVQKSLGLDDLPHIPKSYASMIAEQLR